jgi:pyruvate dehydrogenase E2 component (dihydrolipoamide acetyltransferase)
MADAPPARAASGGVKGETRIEEPSSRQRTIARRVAEARATVPDAQLTAEIDMEAALTHASNQRCSQGSILIRACALALREFPRVNGAYRDGRFEFYSRINIGLVAETEDAFLVPVLFDADRKSLAELTSEIDTLTERARAGALSPPELSGATFTVSDLGSHGVSGASMILSPPQAAALSVGAIRALPIIRGQALVPGHLMTITLACDQRIIYQAHAAAFVTAVKRLIEGAAV